MTLLDALTKETCESWYIVRLPVQYFCRRSIMGVESLDDGIGLEIDLLRDFFTTFMATWFALFPSWLIEFMFALRAGMQFLCLFFLAVPDIYELHVIFPPEQGN
jgi:hypothetical protein